MTVCVERGFRGRVSKPVRNDLCRHIAVNEQRSVCMPQGMHMNFRLARRLAYGFQLCIQIRAYHIVADRICENSVWDFPCVPSLEAFHRLPAPVFFEQIKNIFRQDNPAFAA